MTDLGYGLMSFGTGPAGLLEPDDSGVTLPDPSTLITYLDPVSRDYVYDTDTRQLQQTTGTKQRVMWLLSTEFGSSTGQPDQGFERPRKIGTEIVADIQARVRKTLRPLTDIDRVIVIQSIDVATGGSRVSSTVSYRDLLTNDIQTVTL